MTNNESPDIETFKAEAVKLAAVYHTTPLDLLFRLSCADDTIATRRMNGLMIVHFTYVSDSLIDELINEHFSPDEADDIDD